MCVYVYMLVCLSPSPSSAAMSGTHIHKHKHTHPANVVDIVALNVLDHVDLHLVEKVQRLVAHGLAQDALLDEEDVAARLLDLLAHVHNVVALLLEHAVHLRVVRDNHLVVKLHTEARNKRGNKNKNKSKNKTSKEWVTHTHTHTHTHTQIGTKDTRNTKREQQTSVFGAERQNCTSAILALSWLSRPLMRCEKW